MAARQAMRSISIHQAIDEYRTYNRAQDYSSTYGDRRSLTRRQLPPAHVTWYNGTTWNSPPTLQKPSRW